MWRVPWAVLLCATLAGCGGDEVEAPPSGLSYPSPQVFAAGQALAPVTPTVSGRVTQFSITPALPEGLELATDTGVIWGTGTAASAATMYTVTASNTAGSTSFSMSIAVASAAPAVRYATASVSLTRGAPLQDLTPGNSGGAVLRWSVEPAQLPPGLVFNASDGSIRGTPSATSAPATFTVTAENPIGRSSATLSLSVSSALLELGHASTIASIALSDARALTQDVGGHWVLWDDAAGSIIASGDSACQTVDSTPCKAYAPVAMAGPLVVIGTATGFEVRAASDGRRLATQPVNVSWWKLSTDGSYIGAGSSAGLFAVSPSGTILASRQGDYATASSYVAPKEIRVALGPAGARVVETVSVETGESTLSSPFQGQFHAWFLDGDRFLTTEAAAGQALSTVRTYSASGRPLDTTSLPTVSNLTGRGGWLWTSNETRGVMDIRAVGSSGTPALSYPISSTDRVAASGMTLAVFHNGAGGDEKRAPGKMTQIDLSGPAPVVTDHAVPILKWSTFARRTGSTWWVGGTDGVVLDGTSVSSTPRYLGYGNVLSVAGSPNRTAVATASGRILVFDAATGAFEATIRAFSTKLALSTDGTILATGNFRPAFPFTTIRSNKTFQLPAGSEIRSWDYPIDQPPFPLDINLSASGTRLAQVVQNPLPTVGPDRDLRQVSGVSSASVEWSDSVIARFHPLLTASVFMSPDETLIAASDGPSEVEYTKTNIFKDGRLVATVPGWALGWLDNNRFLVCAHMWLGSIHSVPIKPAFMGCSIYSASGVQLAAPRLPDIETFQSVSADTIYHAGSNTLLSLTTGSVTWSSPQPASGVGAVAGPHVVFVSGHRVLMERYQPGG